MKIEVTQEDIDMGTPSHVCNCPIAIAIKRQTELKEIQVDLYGHHKTSFVNRADRIFGKIELPKECSVFMQTFDQGKPVKPFNFELNLLNDPI